MAVNGLQSRSGMTWKRQPAAERGKGSVAHDVFPVTFVSLQVTCNGNRLVNSRALLLQFERLLLLSGFWSTLNCQQSAWLKGGFAAPFCLHLLQLDRSILQKVNSRDWRTLEGD
jgi:hypothetical protein